MDIDTEQGEISLLKIDPPDLTKQTVMSFDWVDLDEQEELKKLMELPRPNKLLLRYLMEAPLQQYLLYFAKDGFCYISREQYIELIGQLGPQDSLEEACDSAFGKEGDELTTRQKHNQSLFLGAVDHFAHHSAFSSNQIQLAPKADVRKEDVLSLPAPDAKKRKK